MTIIPVQTFDVIACKVSLLGKYQHVLLGNDILSYCISLRQSSAFTTQL